MELCYPIKKKDAIIQKITFLYESNSTIKGHKSQKMSKSTPLNSHGKSEMF